MRHHKRYRTRAEAIDQELVPALAEHTDDVDVEAIFDATFAYKVDHDSEGNEVGGTQGYESATTEGELWTIAAEHEQRIISVDTGPGEGDARKMLVQISVTIPTSGVEVEVLPLPVPQGRHDWQTLIDQRLREANWNRVSGWEDGAYRMRAMVVRIC